MSDSQIFSMNRLERNSRNLLRLLVLIGIISMLLILSLTGYGIYRQSIEDVLRAAEDDAKRIATVMVDEHKNFLFNAGEHNIALNQQEIALFNEHIRKFLHPFGIVKIKVFELNRLIIFSTDANIIGKINDENPRLDRALRGEIDSHLETKDKLVDLAEEQLFDVDVVETYLPLFNAAERIIGSIELYLDVTRYRAEITRRVTISVLILGTILLLVFSISYMIVYIGAQQLKKLLLHLQKMAVTDPLTGIYNRGAVLNRAEGELSRMDRHNVLPPGNSLGVIMIDLDHFKKVNDTYGHQTGDKVLREMTIRVTNCLREYDVFGRYGGEEFLVIVPDGDFKSAIALAERIRHELIKSPFVCGDHKLPITASFGVTSCQDPTEAINVALQRADEALYKAKEEGRNLVVGFE
jgi:diguanylate cyclase (GGDEF)-like protein